MDRALPTRIEPGLLISSIQPFPRCLEEGAGAAVLGTFEIECHSAPHQQGPAHGVIRPEL